jgi:hypothetical protein
MDKPQVVTVRGLRKAYGNRVVVDSLDLDVPAGEIVGLIGANGAGKTTTVECIQGLRRPDGGTIRVLGYDPATQAEELRPLLGSQLQDSALPDRLRVGEAIELFRTPRARDGAGLLEQFSLGVLLGTLLPSARSAQAVGLLLFFPSFLLGAGGPPPNVMGSAVRHIAGPLPLTLLTNAVRGPWLGLGPATGSLIGLAALTVLFTVAAARRAVL